MSNASGPVHCSPFWKHSRPVFALCTVLFALIIMRAPVALDVDPVSSYRTLLYENVRTGHAWGAQFITTDGPLGALQEPGYWKGSVWMAMAWQIAGNLLLTVVLVGAVFQLPRSLQWWILALLAAMLARVPLLAPWLVAVLLGEELVRPRSISPRVAVSLAAALGFLALSSLSHLLLGALAILCTLPGERMAKIKSASALGFVLTFFVGWALLGQPVSAALPWIARALPAVTQTSDLLRVRDTAALASWAGLGSLMLLAILITQSKNQADRREFLRPGVFLLGAMWLTWKTISLQAGGVTEFFFGTSLLIGLIFLARRLVVKGSVALILVAVAGLMRSDAVLVTDAVGQVNRQLVANVRMLTALPQLRANLLAEVKAHASAAAMPRIKSAVGEATVDILGDSPGRALLNGLHVQLRPAPLVTMVRLPAWAKLNAAAYAHVDAPEFVVQSFKPQGDLAAGLADAPSQLALYRNYELQFEENGLMLWKKKKFVPRPDPLLVASGTLAFGETLPLPPAAAAYWLELDVPPGILGRFWKMIDEIPEPGLVVRDTAGTEQRYRLPAFVSSAGFLIEPFVRGEVDFIRRESGANVPHLAEISLAPPVHRGWLEANRWHYRLFKLSDVTLASARLSPEALQNYRLLSRPPVAVSSPSPLNAVAIAPNDFVLFAHPPSLLEFAVTGSDRRVHTRIGILPDAVKGPHPTDGVDFSIEFLGSDGVRRTLYHRWLDPVDNRRDQSQQEVSVDLPRSHGGRLFLRTYNPPGRNDSYDWAFWNYVVIE